MESDFSEDALDPPVFDGLGDINTDPEGLDMIILAGTLNSSSQTENGCIVAVIACVATMLIATVILMLLYTI